MESAIRIKKIENIRPADKPRITLFDRASKGAIKNSSTGKLLEPVVLLIDIRHVHQARDFHRIL